MDRSTSFSPLVSLLQCWMGAGADLPECCSLTSQGDVIALSFHRAGALHLAGMFDAFFETYWRDWTRIREVHLVGEVRGEAEISVIRRSATTGEEAVVSSIAVRGDGSLCLAVELAATGDSYLTVRIRAKEGASVVGLGWSTSEQPVREVRLGIGITTFNRDLFLRKSLPVLAKGLGPSDELIVVNHGEEGLAERLADVIGSCAAIRVIEQENTGGAGGFTRAMKEHRAKGKATHVVLMDDDIDLLSDLMGRIRAVLAFADRPLCVGGAMFDYLDRTKLFSAGDMLRPGQFGISHIVPDGGCDVATPQGVDFLAHAHRPDFNGWWCFALPMEAIDAVGLPMPCFVRGDDVEYGFRLKKAGWPTLGWPGVAVWHMPFEGKSVPWHMFYDWRNNLFAEAMHRRVGQGSVLKKLLGIFFYHLMRFDYDRARAILLGVAAFNRGWAAMAGWTHHDHARLVAVTSVAAGSRSVIGEIPQVKPEPVTGVAKPLVAAGRLLSDLIPLPRRPRAMALLYGVRWRPDYRRRSRHVLELHADETVAREFVYNWRTSLGLAVSLIVVLGDYLLMRGAFVRAKVRSSTLGNRRLGKLLHPREKWTPPFNGDKQLGSCR